MNPNYTIPIIPQNLSKNETIIQIAEVLDHLSNITDSIFNQVQRRLDVNKNKLSDISKRIDVVNEKINKLKGAKKATQVFSSSKYPASDICREYVSVFSDVEHIEIKRHKIKPKNESLVYEPLDKLQLFHVNIASNSKQRKLVGLGDIPHDINCVNDLLLYNSGKNLYKNFVIADALKGPCNIKEEDDKDASDIGPAPHSISERSVSSKSTTQNYFYTPQIGEVPALDVPLDLPDLPGIADDLHYEVEVGPGIAPSATLTSSIIENIAELPAIVENEAEVKDDIPNMDLPPPPPPVQIIDVKPPRIQEEQQPTEPAPVIEKSEVDLPPPPQKEETVQRKVERPIINDARSSLMEDIRKAGGLKKAKLRSIDANEKVTTKEPSGDLMADLHLKLSMRRKGISGTKKQENSVDPDSTFGKISAMIPAPEPKNDVESMSNDDEDWD